MKLEQSFEVAAPLERVWEALIDVQRVAPCLPGASVAGRNEDGSYNGEFKVKIGPTSAAYSGKLNMETVDSEAHSATMQASGTDRRGQGGAKATIISTVAPAGESATRVEVSTDYHITGRLARFGRGGMIEEISQRLLGDFATNLQAMLVGGAGPPAAEEVPADQAPAAEDAPADQAPAAEDAPADQAPAAEDAPADQAPAPEDAPPAEAPPSETLAEEAIASEEVPAQPTDETSAEDPDAAIEGATPVASATEAEPAEPSPPTEPSSAESVAETPPAAAAAPPPPPPPPPAGPATAPAPPPPAGAAP